MRKRIAAAQYCEKPWPHLEFDEFLDPEHAQVLSQEWPQKGWSWLKHSDTVQPDGTSLRRYQRLDEVFPDVAFDLLSGEVDFRDRFGGIDGPLWPLVLLVEDSPGYWIRKHTDCAGKVISAQCYLAQEGAPESQGVLLEGAEPKQIPYRFNHGYAFRVTKGSWHRVRRCQMVRRSIQLIFYDTPTPVI